MPTARVVQALDGVPLGKLAQVQAGAKMITVPMDDGSTGAAGQFGKGPGHFGHDAVREGIALVGARQCDDRDIAPMFDTQLTV